MEIFHTVHPISKGGWNVGRVLSYSVGIITEEELRGIDLSHCSVDVIVNYHDVSQARWKVEFRTANSRDSVKKTAWDCMYTYFIPINGDYVLSYDRGDMHHCVAITNNLQQFLYNNLTKDTMWHG